MTNKADAIPLMEHHLALRLEEMHFQSKRENFTKVWSFVIKVGIKFIGA